MTHTFEVVFPMVMDNGWLLPVSLVRRPLRMKIRIKWRRDRDSTLIPCSEFQAVKSVSSAWMCLAL